MISPPRLPLGDPERARDCEMALEGEVLSLAASVSGASDHDLHEVEARAEQAGWTREEITTAMASLLGNFANSRLTEH